MAARCATCPICASPKHHQKPTKTKPMMVHHSCHSLALVALNPSKVELPTMTRIDRWLSSSHHAKHEPTKSSSHWLAVYRVSLPSGLSDASANNQWWMEPSLHCLVALRVSHCPESIRRCPSLAAISKLVT